MLEIRFDRTHYVARLSKDERQTVARAGFAWNPESKRWESEDPRHAYRLWDHCESFVKNRLLSELGLIGPRIDSIKYSTRRKPFAHQIDFAKWVLSRRASYIAGEAGTGKTMTLPLCLNTSPGPAIVVCPSFLKLNWEDEIETNAINFQHIQITKKQSDLLNPAADIYIIPDSLIHVHEFRERFFALNRRFKYLFIDEAHRFKNPDARRTMSLLGSRRAEVKRRKVIWKGFHRIADHVVAMSGTPMPNRPIELHALIHRHAPHAVNYLDMHRFGVRYCGGFESEWGWDYSGDSNLEELHKILNRNYMLVRRLEDCVDLPAKLPPKFIYLDDTRGTLKLDEMKILNRIKVADIIKMEIERDAAFKKDVMRKLEDSPELGSFGFISELRKMLGLRKVPACVAALKELIEDHKKIIVFCWHKEVATKLCQELIDYKPLKIVGGMSNEMRHKIVKDFQTKDEHRFVVANIDAAGLGITLTAASVVCFVEPDWKPSGNDQAVSRAFRIGQTKRVRTFFFVVKNSLDHLILNAHQDKKQVIQTAIKPS